MGFKNEHVHGKKDVARINGRNARGCRLRPAPFLCINWDTFVETHQGMKRDELNVEVLNPLVALIAGILILIMPRLLNYVVAHLFDRDRHSWPFPSFPFPCFLKHAW